jgi:hypothetical protein
MHEQRPTGSNVCFSWIPPEAHLRRLRTPRLGWLQAVVRSVAESWCWKWRFILCWKWRIILKASVDLRSPLFDSIVQLTVLESDTLISDQVLQVTGFCGDGRAATYWTRS